MTIAGSVCDVQSTNNTHIICVTNAQQQSQQTKVRVSIGNQGIAKMVRERERERDVIMLYQIHFICSDDMFFSMHCVSFFRTMLISSTLTCGRPGSHGVVSLRLRRARLLSSPKARPSCWTPAPLCLRCSLFKVQKVYWCMFLNTN